MATIIPFLKVANAFDQHDITAMSTALDDVCAALHVNGDIASREIIAMRIIDLAHKGERDPVKLRDRMLAASPSASGC